jgi:Protein of unknown function (DUF2911)
MKHHQHFITNLFAFAITLFLGFACNSAEQQTDAGTADSAVVAPEKKEEMPEDKSKRPSPPAKAEAKIGDISISIDYSQPAVKGRVIFGDMVPYGDVWRTGANEATTITFDKDVMIEGQKLVAGTYALFSIPNEKEWTIIFNKKAQQWGAFEYKQEEDALRVNVKPVQEADSMENLTFTVGEDGVVTLKWDKTKVSFKISKA